eukprot:261409_1
MMAWIYFELFCYVIWTLLITHAIYSTVKTRSLKFETWMKKRSVFMYYSLNAATITVIISFLFFAISVIHLSPLIITLTTILWTSSVFIWIFLFVTKNWMIYYQYKWTFYIQQSQWQQIINSNITDTNIKQNWFISNNKTYGQLKFIFKLFGTTAICCCIVSGSIWSFMQLVDSFILHVAVSGAVTIVIYIPWLSLYAFCVWNTPKLNDPFKIHWESRTHAKLLLLTIPNPTICIIYIVVSGDMTAPFFIASFIGSLILFSLIFVSTVYIPKKLSAQNQQDWQIADDGITLQMVLSDETTLNLFMNHLSTEYSMEILLSAIEIMQYQNYVKKLMDKHLYNPRSSAQFVHSIPTSEILDASERLNDIQMDNTDEWNICNAKIKAHKLYNKYMIESAEFEINISGQMRYTLSETLENLEELLVNKSIDLKQLYMVFEDSKQEMITLQNISFERFRAEPEFDAVMAVFNATGTKQSVS